MQLAYDVHADASRMDDVYSPELTLGAGRGYKAGSVVEGGPGMGAVGAVGERGTKGRVRRYDTWHSPARWRRGLLSGRVWFKGVNLVYFLAALATSGLGIYGSVSTILFLSCLGVADFRSRLRRRLASCHGNTGA